MRKTFYFRQIAVIAVLLVVISYLEGYIRHPFEASENSFFGTLLHTVNLIFHEAGHPIMGLFGSDLIMYLGGSLFQVAIPLVVAIYFLLRREYVSVGIMLMWVATNISEVAIYAGDAIDRQLPLLGEGPEGDRSHHDWYNILIILGVLRSAPRIQNFLMDVSGVVFFAGIVCTLYPILHTTYLVLRDDIQRLKKQEKTPPQI